MPESSMFLERDLQEVCVEAEEEELAPEVKDIVYELKDVTEKVMSLNKILLHDDKSPYRVSYCGKRRYPLISSESSIIEKDSPDGYIELPEEWEITADFVMSTTGKSIINNDFLPCMLCFIREETELRDGNIAVLKICQNDRYKLMLQQLKHVNGLMEFRNSNGEKMENFEVKGIVVFWMSDYRTESESITGFV